jgi:riboflavin synthase
VVETRAEGDSTRFVFAPPEGFARYVVPKGSIALDGVSLTVNEVDETGFGVNIISHTRRHTTFGRLAGGDRVNFEVDTIARYVDRLMARS